MIDVDISVARIKRMETEDLDALERLVVAECPHRLNEIGRNVFRACDELHNEALALQREADEQQVIADAMDKIGGGTSGEVAKRAGIWPLTSTWQRDLIEAAKRWPG